MTPIWDISRDSSERNGNKVSPSPQQYIYSKENVLKHGMGGKNFVRASLTNKCLHVTKFHVEFRLLCETFVCEKKTSAMARKARLRPKRADRIPWNCGVQAKRPRWLASYMRCSHDV